MDLMPKVGSTVESRKKDFLGVVTRQFATSDFDAEHPLYRYLARRFKLDLVHRRWLSFLYMAFYDEASAWVVFNNSDPFTIPAGDIALKLPIGTNRRNLYGGKVMIHLASLQDMAESAANWPEHNFTGNNLNDWETLKANIGTVWGNGRFGSFTTAEMLQKVCGSPVEVADFDNKNSSAPRDGVCRLYGCRDELEEVDRLAEQTYQEILKLGIKPPYTAVDRGVVESVLCNYSAMCRGRFYSGRNVDRQQAKIMRVEALGYDLSVLWDARRAVLKKEHLGELNGWVGIDRPRMKLFRDEGKLLWTYEER